MLPPFAHIDRLLAMQPLCSTTDGDTVQTLELKYTPREIHFATQKVTHPTTHTCIYTPSMPRLCHTKGTTHIGLNNMSVRQERQ
jgi:hypothetical protein